MIKKIKPRVIQSSKTSLDYLSIILFFKASELLYFLAVNTASLATFLGNFDLFLEKIYKNLNFNNLSNFD